MKANANTYELSCLIFEGTSQERKPLMENIELVRGSQAARFVGY